MDEQNTNTSNNTNVWTFIVALAVVALLAFFAAQLFEDRDTTGSETTPLSEETTDGQTTLMPTALLFPDDPSEVAANIRFADYGAAVREYEELVSSPEYEEFSDEQKARAFFTVSGALFKQSGDIEDAKATIREYKEIVTNENVSPEGRAIVLNSLATSYCGYGRDTRVLDTLYSGEEFEKHWVEGSPGLASRHMLEWSYSIYPTARAAIGISHWYAKELIGPAELTQEKRTEYLRQTKRYLREADVFVEQEIERAPRYARSKQYASFRYWRAFTIGALALAQGGEYVDQYEKEFEDMIAFISAQENHLTYQYLPFAYWLYAAFVEGIEGDTARAQQYLAQSVALVELDPKPSVNDFVLFVWNEKQKESGDWLWGTIFSMAAISEEFNTFVVGI